MKRKSETNMLRLWAAVFAGVYTLWPILIALEVSRLEKPLYNVTEKIGAGIELRDYASFVVAAADVEGPIRKSVGEGFLEVAGYIFGKNKINNPGDGDEEESIKISMTTPVRYECKAGQKGEVSFPIPREFELRSLPKPLSRRVQLKTVPSRKLAAIRCRGAMPDENEVAKRFAELTAALAAHELEPVGDVELHQYHPPFAPNWMRRNEVLTPFRPRPATICGLPVPRAMVWENSV